MAKETKRRQSVITRKMFRTEISPKSIGTSEKRPLTPGVKRIFKVDRGVLYLLQQLTSVTQTLAYMEELVETPIMLLDASAIRDIMGRIVKVVAHYLELTPHISFTELKSEASKN